MIAGVLQPLIERLLGQPRPRPGMLSGQAIALHSPVKPYVAVDHDGHVHLLLSPAAADPIRFEKFRRPAFEIANRLWAVSGGPVIEYLDVMLFAGPQSALRRPFISFCEDVLVDFEGGLSPEDAVYRTCSRWKRFWEDGGAEIPPVTWILGLLGELLVLEALVQGSFSAIDSWTGPDGAAHDFQVGTTAALEVKTSARMPPVIECNLAQLDSGGAGDLFLVVLHATSRENALTLPAMVSRLEERLAVNEDLLDLFLAKLARTGYRRHLAADYAVHAFDIAPPIFHLVDDTFPRMTHASFLSPLDARIRQVRYSVELTGLRPLSADDARLRVTLRALSGA